MPKKFVIQIDTEAPVTQADISALIHSLASHKQLAGDLNAQDGHLEITLQVDAIHTADELFKAGLSHLPDDTRLVDLIRLNVFLLYHQAISPAKALLVTGSLKSCYRSGLTTLGDVRHSNEAVLSSLRNVGPKKVRYLTWLFDL